MNQTQQQSEKSTRHRGTTLGLYFPGLSHEEANELRTRLNTLAADWGYLAERGGTAGQGAVGRLLMALAKGELHLCKGEEESSSSTA